MFLSMITYKRGIHMEKIVIGNKTNEKFGFRETCFGIVIKNDKALLVKKDNQFSLVGGGIEKNESHEECLKREFLEETGYLIKRYEELVSIDCFWLAGNKWPLESLANIYIVQVDEETKIEPLENEHTIEFVNINEAENLLPLPYHKFAIYYYLKTKK